MLFEFTEYIDDLRDNSEKSKMIHKYEEQFGEIPDKIEDMNLYKEYLSLFEFSKGFVGNLHLPEDLEDAYDYDLLLKLCSGSFSSEMYFEIGKENKIELVISVENEEQTVTKILSELWGYQINRLIEIYIEEQMNMTLVMYENDEEIESVGEQRKAMLRKHDKQIKKAIDLLDSINFSKNILDVIL